MCGDRIIILLTYKNNQLGGGSVILDKRRAGVLLHLTSLPCKYGYGALNKEAMNFVDFLAECKLSLWQMLPIHPTHGLSHPDFLSPYQCQSVHAGNPLLISLQSLDEQGVELQKLKFKLPDDNKSLAEYRYICLKTAYNYSRQNATTDVEGEKYAFIRFQHKNSWWLKDYALFRVIKERFGHSPWWDWEKPYRDRDPQTLAKIQQECQIQLEQQCYEQFVFVQEWHRLKNYANNKKVYLIGDMPFFVAEDSVEMWAYRDNFLLNDQGRAKYYAGTEPQDDYFKQGQGQCWKLPVYNWDHMETNNFQWWIQRFNTMSRLFDMVRLTHFRGYVRTWAIPSETSNPKDGFWLPAHGEKMFERLKTEWQHPIPMIVDDIGVEKENEKNAYNLWHDKFSIEDTKNQIQSRMFGTRVLQLGFSGKEEKNSHIPHNYTINRVVYTGTHDHPPILCWFNQLEGEKRANMFNYFNIHEEEAGREQLTSVLIRNIFGSVSKFAIIPMQDILRLANSQDRMNTPGEIDGCWQWQFQWTQLKNPMKIELRQLVEWYQR